MVDNASPTLAPESSAPAVPELLPPQSTPQSESSQKSALFDSLKEDGGESVAEGKNATLKTVFAILLWVGYSVATVISLVLVWSAVRGLMRAIPR